MELRTALKQMPATALAIIEPPPVSRFLLLGEPIAAVAGRPVDWSYPGYAKLRIAGSALKVRTMLSSADGSPWCRMRDCVR